MIVSIDLDIDFDLLREQKAMLVNISPFTDIHDNVEGLIALLDGIQDEAARIFGEEAVFGALPA